MSEGSSESQEKERELYRGRATPAAPPLLFQNWSSQEQEFTGASCAQCGREAEFGTFGTSFFVSDPSESCDLDAPPRLYHLDCYFDSLPRTVEVAKAYTEACANVWRKRERVLRGITEAGYLREAGDEESLWWKSQTKRLSILPTSGVIIDWFSVDWSELKGWIGNRHKQSHTVSQKRELFTWAALLSHYGQGESQLPPVALGLGFYRSLSILRKRSFGAANQPRPDSTSIMEVNRPFSELFDIRRHLPLTGCTDVASWRNGVWGGVVGGVPLMMQELVMHGQADLLSIYMQGNNYGCLLSREFQRSALHDHGILICMTTQRLLLNEFVRSAPSDEEVSSLISMMMCSSNPQFVELALEMWPMMSDEQLALPFQGWGAPPTIEHCYRVMKHPVPGGVDWSKVCAALVRELSWLCNWRTSPISVPEQWKELLLVIQFFQRQDKISVAEEVFDDSFDFWVQHCLIDHVPEAKKCFELLCSKHDGPYNLEYLSSERSRLVVKVQDGMQRDKSKNVWTHKYMKAVLDTVVAEEKKKLSFTNMLSAFEAVFVNSANPMWKKETRKGDGTVFLLDHKVQYLLALNQTEFVNQFGFCLGEGKEKHLHSEVAVASHTLETYGVPPPLQVWGAMMNPRQPQEGVMMWPSSKNHQVDF